MSADQQVVKSENQPLEVRRVDWHELFPWVIIFRAFAVATRIEVILIAALGVLVSPCGWILVSWILPPDQLANDYQLSELVQQNNNSHAVYFQGAATGEMGLAEFAWRLSGPTLVFAKQVSPFYHAFHDLDGIQRCLYFVVGGCWNILVWAFCGTGICRIAVLQLTRGERIGVAAAWSYALRHFWTSVCSILYPLLGASLLALPLAMVGLLLTFDLGVLIVGMLWLLVLLLALLIGLLLLGAMFGWPLMFASVGAESQDAFDALTRAFAYTFQRPLHYLFYFGVALSVGGVIWIAAARFTDGVINLSYWSVSWGANAAEADRVDQIQFLLPPVKKAEAVESSELGDSVDPLGDGEASLPGLVDGSAANTGVGSVDSGRSSDESPGEQAISRSLRLGHQAIEFWNNLLRCFAVGFLNAMFWCSAVAVYLLLRKDVDDTEMDEVFVDDQRQTFNLPPLKNDETGMPVLDHQATAAEEAAGNEMPEPAEPGPENEGVSGTETGSEPADQGGATDRGG